MKIFPAIDLLGGKAVRLTKGDYDKSTVYNDNPVSVAEGFYNDGARYLHVVDLDGAKDGKTTNFETVSRIIGATGMYCEIGGGIRDMERIEMYLECGVDRVILGTAAVNNPEFRREAVKKYGEKIAVGVDAKDGFVAVNGWLEKTSVKGVDFCRQLRDEGVSSIIYTDISKDGMLSGTNLELYRELSTISGIEFTASGGITDIEELYKLKDMGVSAAILGKALYAGKLDLKTVIEELGAE